MLAVITICRLDEPTPAAAFRRKMSIVGRTTFRLPPTFVANVLRTFSSFSIPVPIPALENTTSSGAAALHSSIHLRTASSSVTSSTSPRMTGGLSETLSAAAASHLRTTAATRSASRPQKKMLRVPRFAHSTASASPMPLEAPVMRTVSGFLTLHLWSRAFRLGSFDADTPSSNRACEFPAPEIPSPSFQDKIETIYHFNFAHFWSLAANEPHPSIPSNSRPV